MKQVQKSVSLVLVKDDKPGCVDSLTPFIRLDLELKAPETGRAAGRIGAAGNKKNAAPVGVSD